MPNKVEYCTDSGTYCTTHDVKVPFLMPQLSTRKMITHRFHIYNGYGVTFMVHEMIIVYDLMVQLGLIASFKCNLLEQDFSVVPTEEPGNLLFKPNLANCQIQQVIMQTKNMDSTKEVTERIFNILDSNYEITNIEMFKSITTQVNPEER